MTKERCCFDLDLNFFFPVSHPAAEHVEDGPRGHLAHDDHYQDADELAETEAEWAERAADSHIPSPFRIPFTALEVL